MKKIIAFSGSNSSKSINQQLVKIVASMVSNAEIEVIDLRDYPAPMYGIDEETTNGIPENMQQLSLKIAGADGVIIASPEHNGMTPAFLKSALDWISRTGDKPFAGRKLLLLSTSPGGRGGVTNLNNMAAVMPHWGATVVDTLSVGKFYDKVTDGKPSDELAAELKEKVDKLVNAL
jgi:chromate reductase